MTGSSIFAIPSLGDQLQAFRHGLGLSIATMAGRLQLSPSHLYSLEQDDALPTETQFIALSIALSHPTYRLRRAIQVSALRQLHAVLAPDYPGTVHDLPVPIRIALADARRLPRTDPAALEREWASVCSDSPDRQQILFEAAVVDMALDGEPWREPLWQFLDRTVAKRSRSRKRIGEACP